MIKCMYEVLVVGFIAQVCFAPFSGEFALKLKKKQKFEFESVLVD